MSANLFDVQRGEGVMLAQTVGFAFLCVGAQTYAFIASDTLFVSTFELGALSRFYLVVSVLRGAVSLAYGALAHRASGKTTSFDVKFLIAVAAVNAVGFAGLVTGSSALVYAGTVVLVLLPSLLPLVAIGAALDRFNARQGRRLLPLVSAGATLGAIVAGGSARLLAPWIGAPALALVSSTLCLLAIPLASAMATRTDQALAPPKSVKAGPSQGAWAAITQSFDDMREVSVVRVFAVNAVFAAVMTTFVDFAFKAVLKARYGRDDLAGAIGTFNVVAEATALFAQLFLTSRVIGWLGVGRALKARPAVMLGLAPLVVLAPPVMGTATVKLGEVLLRLSLGGTVADLMLTPAPAPVRGRAKVVAKALTLPLGALLAGGVLSLFGTAGPTTLGIALILGATAAVTLVALSGANSAYTAALAKALTRPGSRLDVPAQVAEPARREVARMLAESVASADSLRTRTTIHAAGDLLSLTDLAPALDAGGEMRRDATDAAIRAAQSGEGALLLRLVPPSSDPRVERELLARARQVSPAASLERLERAQRIGEASPSDRDAADLWGEALVGLAAISPESATESLRQAARGLDSPMRASALRSLGDLKLKSAETEILSALDSTDVSVFSEAARSAVLIDARGAVNVLALELQRGPRAHAAGKALALAGGAAVSKLIASLPTRGGPILATAESDATTMTGSIRAARVLARLGPEACERALQSLPALGFRARNAVIHALAALPIDQGRSLDRTKIQRAMESTLLYGELLREELVSTPAGLLRGELAHRVGETADRMLDLASLMGDRSLVARARAGLHGDTTAKNNALELLENVLPRKLAARTVKLLEWRANPPPPPTQVETERGNGRRAPPASTSAGRWMSEGWLSICRSFDQGTLSKQDPMLPILERLLVIREAPLFANLSSEELYPVAEIARVVEYAPGETVVRQGDPGDTFFVVVSGTLSLVRDGVKARELQRGAMFGELALLDGAPRAATVQALSDAELLCFPREEFETLLDESPEIAKGVIRMLLGYLRNG